MKLKLSSLFYLLALLLQGFYFSYAGQIDIDVSPSARLQAAEKVYDAVQKEIELLERMYNGSLNDAAKNEIRQKIYNIKNSRFALLSPIFKRSNIYLLGGTILSGVAIDYLLSYFNSHVDVLPDYSSVAPPSECEFLYYPCQYRREYSMSGYGTGGQANAIVSGYSYIKGWFVNRDGSCRPITGYVPLNPPWRLGNVQDKLVYSPYYSTYFLVGHSPEAFLLPNCPPSSTSPSRPKRVHPLLPPKEDFLNKVPNNTLHRTLQFPDNPNIKTPDDIPPLSNGDVVFAPVGSSPDNEYSPNLSSPVPDFEIDAGFNITAKYNDQTYSSSSPSSSPNNFPSTGSPSTDYNYTPVDANLDTDIKAPDKKDISSLITSNINQLKSKFTFDSSCGGGTCSFSVNVFDSTATIDFCQFESQFALIGTVILVFSYFYAFFIVVRGG